MGVIGARAAGGCTGTLIAPDLVLTAAHCIPPPYDPKSFLMVFRTSKADGTLGDGAAVRATAVQPMYRVLAAEESSELDLRNFDMAVARLAEPIPESVARPLPVATPSAGDKGLHIVSYRGGGSGTRRERPCPTIKLDDRNFAVACEVRSGESGSPLIELRPEGPVVVGVVTLSERSDKGEAALGPITGPAFNVLRALAPP